MSDKMTMMKRIKRLFVPLMLCLFLGGCDAWIGDPRVDVIGKVTMDKKVLTDAIVVFVPVRFRNDEGLVNHLSYGKTDGTGRFELRSDKQKGVLLGRYRVLIFREGDLRSVADETAVGVASLLNEPNADKMSVADIPGQYNLHTELEYVVELPVGIVYPEFDLTSK